MKSLVESVYSKLNMVNQFVDSDADILAILNGAYEEVGFTGLGANNEDCLLYTSSVRCWWVMTLSLLVSRKQSGRST